MQPLRQLFLPVSLTAISLCIFIWAGYRLGKGIDLTLLAVLGAPALLYFRYFRNDPATESVMSRKSALALIAYSLFYFIATYRFNLLAASISLWLVQFLIPVLILKVLGDPISAAGFRWRDVSKGKPVLIGAALILAPILIFIVRDSEKILTLLPTWKGPVYLVLATLYMLVIVAFWEEFFFRGVLLKSLLTVTDRPSLSIFLSSLAFGTYHVPMRFMNERSEHYGNLVSSIASTLSEQFILGLFLGLIVYKSKNIWHGIWLHALINGISYIYKLSVMLPL